MHFGATDQEEICMKPFTLVLAYYDNPMMLRAQCESWGSLPAAIRAQLHVIVVDDCSPRWPAPKDYADGSFIASSKLFRIGVDMPWNQDAARNIGAHEAQTEWLMLTDMDHLVPHATWDRLMSAPLHHKTAYRFARVTAPAMTPYHPHPNSWAMTRKLFWKAGGYDERLAGNYGTDGDLLNRLRERARLDDLPQHLIRVPREHIPDASTTTLERKNPDQKRLINEILRVRNAAGLEPLHFQFPYVRVL